MIHAENLTKRRTAGREPTRQTIRDLNDTSIEKGTRILPPSNRQPNSRRIKKQVTPRLRFGETVDARAFTPKDPPTTYTNDSTIEYVGTPTEDWLRRQAFASIRRPIPQPEKEKTTLKTKTTETTIHIMQTPPKNKQLQPPSCNPPTIEQNENAPNDQPSSQSTEGDAYDSPKETIFLDDFPISLNSIKKYVTEKKR